MDPKNAEYPDAAVSWLLYAYHAASSGMCLKKSRHALGGNFVKWA